MSGEKYIGLDVHQATICAAVMDPMGKVIIESILESQISLYTRGFASRADVEQGPPHPDHHLTTPPRRIELQRIG
jgi:hypothetical protein